MTDHRIPFIGGRKDGETYLVPKGMNPPPEVKLMGQHGHYVLRRCAYCEGVEVAVDFQHMIGPDLVDCPAALVWMGRKK